VCGTKTFLQCVCTRRRNCCIGQIVIIPGICAFGEQDQARSFAALKKRPAIRTSTRFFLEHESIFVHACKENAEPGTKREVSHCWFKGLRITHL
jgi:hypothetical protein